ncbi:hypothetical protein HDG37_001549 [Paraburkholderia sp. MM5384-R2]|nr:hypothetical protein [Paraburkholderia sp. MM5384-R2]
MLQATPKFYKKTPQSHVLRGFLFPASPIIAN